MDHVRLHGTQQFSRVRKTGGNAKAFAKLTRHERLSIAKAHDLAAAGATARQNMLVGDFTAADDGNAQVF